MLPGFPDVLLAKAAEAPQLGLVVVFDIVFRSVKSHF